MNKKNIFTEDDIQKIINLYQSDISVAEICKLYNIATIHIQKILKNNNVFKPNYLTKIKYDIAIKLLNKQEFIQKFEELNNLQKLADYYGCGRDLIISMLKRYDLCVLMTYEKKNKRIDELKKNVLSRENLLKLYHDQHITFENICKQFKIAKSSLIKIFKEYNIKVRSHIESQLPKNYNNFSKDVNYLQEIRNKCNNIHEVAKLLNCGRDVATRLFKQNNLAMYTNEVRDRLYRDRFSLHYPEYEILEKHSTYIEIKHKKCNYVFDMGVCMLSLRIRNNTTNFLCPKCFRRKSTSTNEQLVANYIRELLPNIEIHQNVKTLLRKNREIDIYIPSKNIAIEYCGLYYHSEDMGKYKEYHKEKYNLCKEKGIRLITIFEDEWLHKQDIVKSKLTHILNMTNKKIYARNCVIREILSSIKNTFLEQYHLQGKDKSKIKLGIYHNDELVGVCTFSHLSIAKGKFKKDNTKMELNRYATSIHVVGGLGKCIAYLKRYYDVRELITFADLRWSDGNVYKKLGFIELYETSPNYWYIPPKAIYRLHRYNFRKNILFSKFENVDLSKTEVKIMQDNKYRRIWDCGSKKFSLIFN